MDARGKRIAGIALLLFVTMGASYRTPNFVVSTNDAGLARQIAEAAEHYRSQLSMEWLGESIPNWSSPCTMNVHIGQNLGAGGATTFLFDRGEVYGWRMNIQGSRQRIFDSVLPHEITHMILASHFREPLPRWGGRRGRDFGRVSFGASEAVSELAAISYHRPRDRVQSDVCDDRVSQRHHAPLCTRLFVDGVSYSPRRAT